MDVLDTMTLGPHRKPCRRSVGSWFYALKQRDQIIVAARNFEFAVFDDVRRKVMFLIQNIDGSNHLVVNDGHVKG